MGLIITVLALENGIEMDCDREDGGGAVKMLLLISKEGLKELRAESVVALEVVEVKVVVVEVEVEMVAEEFGFKELKSILLEVLLILLLFCFLRFNALDKN